MSKFGDDIRRISRYEQLLKLIREAQSTADQAKKLAISGTRSIAYLDKKTLSAIQQAATRGATKPNTNVNKLLSASGDAEQTADDALLAAKNAVSQALNNSNPLNGLGQTGASDDLTSTDNNARDGWYDTQALIDGAVDAAGKLTPESLANSALKDFVSQFTGDIVNSLTNLQTDDETRQLVVHLLDASKSIIGPTDWENAWERPTDPSYTAGRVWTLISGANNYFGTAFYELVANREAVDGTKCYSTTGTGSLDTVTSTTPTAGTALLFSGNHSGVVGNTVGSLGGTTYAFQAYAPATTILIGRYGQQDCGLTLGDGVWCSADPPPANKFSSDLGVTQLAWVSPITPISVPLAATYVGRFMPSPYDINVPEIYEEGASILDLKTLDGTPIRIRPLRDGGWAIYERNPASNNDPAGDASVPSVFILNANRTVYGYVSPNSLLTLLPI